jgi:phosphate transport system permease protein
MLYGMVSNGAAFQVRKLVLDSPEMIGQTLPIWVAADDDIDMLMKGHFDLDVPETERRIKDIQLAWVDRLQQEDRVEKRFNRTFFTAGDSREPEQAGILGCGDGIVYTPW